MRNLMKATALPSPAIALVALVIAASVASAQVTGAAKQPSAGSRLGSAVAAMGGCSTADKVMVTNMTLTPAAPKQGDQVTVTLTVKNLCNVVEAVPWQISGPGTLILGSGVQQNVVAGASFVVRAVWTATPGPGGAYGWADPKNVLSESIANRQNNGRAVAVTVPLISASTQGTGGTVRYVEEVLSYVKAQNAGARFAHNIEPGSACDKIGQFDARTWGSPESQDKTMAFVILCNTGFGGKANPEAFSGFTLQNGWSVRRVETSELGPTVNADWQYLVPPPGERSVTPYLKMRLWANAPGRASRWVKVVIAGPEGTCPYQVQSGPCP